MPTEEEEDRGCQQQVPESAAGSDSLNASPSSVIRRIAPAASYHHNQHAIGTSLASSLSSPPATSERDPQETSTRTWWRAELRTIFLSLRTAAIDTILVNVPLILSIRFAVALSTPDASDGGEDLSAFLLTCRRLSRPWECLATCNLTISMASIAVLRTPTAGKLLGTLLRLVAAPFLVAYLLATTIGSDHQAWSSTRQRFWHHMWIKGVGVYIMGTTAGYVGAVGWKPLMSFKRALGLGFFGAFYVFSVTFIVCYSYWATMNVEANVTRIFIIGVAWPVLEVVASGGFELFIAPQFARVLDRIWRRRFGFTRRRNPSSEATATMSLSSSPTGATISSAASPNVIAHSTSPQLTCQSNDPTTTTCSTSHQAAEGAAGSAAAALDNSHRQFTRTDILPTSSSVVTPINSEDKKEKEKSILTYYLGSRRSKKPSNAAIIPTVALPPSAGPSSAAPAGSNAGDGSSLSPVDRRQAATTTGAGGEEGDDRVAAGQTARTNSGGGNGQRSMMGEEHSKALDAQRRQLLLLGSVRRFQETFFCSASWFLVLSQSFHGTLSTLGVTLVLRVLIKTTVLLVIVLWRQRKQLRRTKRRKRSHQRDRKSQGKQSDDASGAAPSTESSLQTSSQRDVNSGREYEKQLQALEEAAASTVLVPEEIARWSRKAKRRLSRYIAINKFIGETHAIFVAVTIILWLSFHMPATQVLSPESGDDIRSSNNSASLSYLEAERNASARFLEDFFRSASFLRQVRTGNEQHNTTAEEDSGTTSSSAALASSGEVCVYLMFTSLLAVAQQCVRELIERRLEVTATAALRPRFPPPSEDTKRNQMAATQPNQQQDIVTYASWSSNTRRQDDDDEEGGERRVEEDEKGFWTFPLRNRLLVASWAACITPIIIFAVEISTAVNLF